MNLVRIVCLPPKTSAIWLFLGQRVVEIRIVPVREIAYAGLDGARGDEVGPGLPRHVRFDLGVAFGFA
jgi:hypothetical protein